MLQETTQERRSIVLLEKGFYYHIRTSRAVWSRVQVVERSRYYIRVFYMVMQRRRRKRQLVKRVEDLPVLEIIEARRYQ